MLLFFKFFLCGILTSFIFPPFFLTPLGFIIFPYLIYLLDTNKKNLSYFFHFFLGFIYGIGFFSIFLLWLREPFFLDENTQNYAFFSYLLILYCSLYFGLIFCIIKYFKKIYFKILMFPALLVLSEFICANFSYGFPWFSFALINSNNILGTTIVFYLGSLGLSYITILVFLFPYILLLKKKKNIKFFLIAYLNLFFLILILIFSKLQVETNKEFSFLSVEIIQLNYQTNQHLSINKKEEKLKEIIQRIRSSKSEIIIFGENEFPFLMNKENISFLQNNLNKNQQLIIGSTRKESNKYFNSLFMINKNFYKKFDKKILVPFGEFIPFRSIFNFMEFIGGSIDFSSGLDERRIQIEKNFFMLPIICYEIIYFSKILKKNDTNIIFNITNDSWFGDFLGPYQHFYFTKLRAAEFNKPIIRVSSNGISGFIHSNGLVKNFIRLNKKDNKRIIVLKEKIHKNYLNFHQIFFSIIIFSLVLGFFFGKKDE